MSKDNYFIERLLSGETVEIDDSLEGLEALEILNLEREYKDFDFCNEVFQLQNGYGGHNRIYKLGFTVV